MPHKQASLTAVWAEQWTAGYLKLSPDRQNACDEAAMALIKQVPLPGLRIKPIHPDKYYFEARINSGDRLVFRIQEGTIFFVDVVKHDDISRYGRRPKR